MMVENLDQIKSKSPECKCVNIKMCKSFKETYFQKNDEFILKFSNIVYYILQPKSCK